MRSIAWTSYINADGKVLQIGGPAGHSVPIGWQIDETDDSSKQSKYARSHA